MVEGPEQEALGDEWAAVRSELLAIVREAPPG
jgi:hypothetical protein